MVAVMMMTISGKCYSSQEKKPKQCWRSVKTMQLDNLIEKYETDSAELLKVGAVEPAEEKQLIANLLKELKEYRNEKTGSMQSNIG
jgi:hypothetical protein